MGLYEDLMKSDEELDPVDVLGSLNLTMPNKSSGSRSHLVTGYMEQWLILNESEVPKVYTGFERELGMYNDSLKLAKTTYKILNRLEKFPAYPGTHYTLVVQDMVTGTVDTFEIKHYEKLAEDHGYFKPHTETDFKNVGSIIEKGSVISKANSHDEYLNYKYGVNANVAYISKKDNIEDGIIISESFAKRVSYASVKTIDVTLGFNDVLLNIYGNDNIYRSFPDIFTEIKGGVFCAKRAIDNMNAGCNSTIDSLRMIDTNDELYHGDGKVIDVEIFINSNAELIKDNGHRQQIITYYNIVRDYKFRIMKALEPYVKDPLVNLTTEANTRYYNCKNYIDACNSPTNEIRFANSTGTFEFAFLKFTIGKSVNISLGSKLTNRFGGKGVDCSIVPDEMMPIDEYGVRAEVILNPCGVVGRSNPGQLYEHELNFIADRIADMIGKEKTLHDKYNLLVKFLSMVDSDSCTRFQEYYRTMSNVNKHKYMDDIVKNGIYVRQHPFHNLSYEDMKNLYTTFNVKPGPVTVSVLDRYGKLHKFKSKNNVVIGKEYIFVLKHTTESKFSSVSISDVNSLGIPHRSSTKTKSLPFRNTPIKFGQMEVNIALIRVNPLKINRFMAGNGGNLKHRDRVSKMLLEEDPFVYHDVNVKDEDVVDSISSDAFVAIMHQMGYSIFNDKNEVTLDVGVNDNIKS